MRSLVISICIALTVAVASAADNWPHFRTNGGVADDDPRLSDKWSATENVAWKTAVPGLGWGSPIVWGNHARQRIDSQASGFSASPWAYNGRIFVASEDGDVYVIEAGPAFRILHKNSMGEMIGSGTPAIAKGSVIIRTASALWKIAKAGTP